MAQKITVALVGDSACGQVNLAKFFPNVMQMSGETFELHFRMVSSTTQADVTDCLVVLYVFELTAQMPNGADGAIDPWREAVAPTMEEYVFYALIGLVGSEPTDSAVKADVAGYVRNCHLVYFEISDSASFAELLGRIRRRVAIYMQPIAKCLPAAMYGRIASRCTAG
jgi:hypothetical protein